MDRHRESMVRQPGAGGRGSRPKRKSVVNLVGMAIGEARRIFYDAPSDRHPVTTCLACSKSSVAFDSDSRAMIEAQDSGAGPAVHSQDSQALDSEWCFLLVRLMAS